MSGAQFFVNTLKTFNDMEFRREQALRDENYRRDVLAEQSRQSDVSNRFNRDRLNEQTRQFDVSADYNNAALGERTRNNVVNSALEARRIDLMGQKVGMLGSNIKEREQKETALREAKQAQMAEVEQREALKAEQAQMFQATNKRLKSGEVVDISQIALGPNVDGQLVNDARGNSGRGGGIFSKYDAENDRHYLMTYDAESNEYLPFTADPEDNDSTPLFVEGNSIMETLYSVASTRNEIEQTDPDGSVMSSFLAQNGMLVTDDDGRVVTRHRHDIEQKARAEVVAQNKLIDKENQTRQSAWESQQSPEAEEGIVSGRQGGVVDELADVAGDVPGTNLLTVGGVVEAVTTSEGLGEAINFLFGDKSPEKQEQEKQRLEKKTKGKPPEKQQRIVFDEYLKDKYGATLAASERAYMSKLREGSIGALQATQSDRRKVADLYLKADPSVDTAALQNYVKRGVMASEADLQALGIKNQSELLALKTQEVEYKQALQELKEGESMSSEDQLKYLTPLVDDAVLTATNQFGGAKGASFELNKEQAKWRDAWTQWHVATNTPVKTGLEGKAFYNGVTQANYALQGMFTDNGFSVTSVSPGMAVATRFPEALDNPEQLKGFGQAVIREAERTKQPIEVILQDFMYQ